MQKRRYDTMGIGQVDEEDHPSNMESMERDELQFVCASYGVKYAKNDTKDGLIKKLEQARYKVSKEMTLMLNGRKADGRLLITEGDSVSLNTKKEPQNDEGNGKTKVVKTRTGKNINRKNGPFENRVRKICLDLDTAVFKTF
eukprot:CFRG8223T1